MLEDKPGEDAPADAFAIADWSGLDASLGDLIVTRARGRALQAEHDQRLEAVRTERAEALAPVIERCDRLVAAVDAFLAPRRADVVRGKTKSRVLTHGKVGWRMGQPHVELTVPEAEAVAALEELGHTNCVKVEKSVLKTPCKLLGELDLGLAGIRIVPAKEAHYFELTESAPVT